MSQSRRFTILDRGHPIELDATPIGDRVLLSPAAMQQALGWELRPEGLCRGDVCVPLGPDSRLIREGSIDLNGFAEQLGLPLATEPSASCAYIGESAGMRRSVLESLEAPDFTLPDLDGRPHSLSEQRGKKVLLVAYASW